MIIEKKHYISFGIDLVSFLLALVTLPIHIFFLKLHPFYKFIEQVSLNQLKITPELLPDASIINTGLPYVLFLVLLNVVIIFAIYLFSRVLLYNYLIHKKFTFKYTLRNLKALFASFFLAHIPAATILFIIYMGIAGFFFLITLPFQTETLNFFIRNIPAVFLFSTFILFSLVFYISSIKVKQIVPHYSKILATIKQKDLYLAPLYTTIFLFLVLAFQKYILAKIPVMYSQFSFLGFLTSVSDFWAILIFLIVITYLRFAALKLTKS